MQRDSSWAGLRGWSRVALVVLGVAFAARGARAERFDEEDSSTPRGAVARLLAAAEQKDKETLASALNVPRSASAAKRTAAADLGQKLARVLSQSARFDLDDVSDDPKGKPDDGADVERIATLRGRERDVPVLLERSKVIPNTWVVSAGTQTRIPELYERYGPSKLEVHVPPQLRAELLGLPSWQWLGIVTAIVGALVLGRLIAFLLNHAAERVAKRTRMLWDDELVSALRSPLRLFFSVFVYAPLAHALALPGNVRLISIRAVSLLGIAALAWIATRVVGVIGNVMERRATEHEQSQGARSQRAARTQVRVLRRVLNLVLGGCAVALMLMQFEVVRSVGVSLLASAGLAGVVLGLAAQRTLGSIFAGIQLSITQPIRIGDDVIIEGEFGTIEEITLTYVVVRIWDERRLIVPMSRFLEHPFQNWTKVSSRLHGTVLLQADFTLPVGALRAEVDRLVESNPLWDRRTKAVQVTDARERTLEVRILVSAEDGGKLFDLRAQLREKLAAWLASFEDGRHLPRLRTASPAGGADAD